MRETTKETGMLKTQWKAPHYGACVVVLCIGLLAGRAFFPLEIPTPFVVEKEKRVEVPVEVIRYVDRRIEVPVDRLVAGYAEGIAQKVGSNGDRHERWNQVKKGMSQRQVLDVLGRPDGQPEALGGSILYRWGGAGIRRVWKFFRWSSSRADIAPLRRLSFGLWVFLEAAASCVLVSEPLCLSIE